MKTIKAAVWAAVLVVLVGVAVYGVTALAAGSDVGLPERVTTASRCPVAGCTSSSCHGAGPAPEVAVGGTMVCPKVGCEAETCHASDRLTSHYNEPKTSSLNLWILGLSLFTIAMIAISLYL